MKHKTKSEQELRNEIEEAIKGLNVTRSPAKQNGYLDTCNTNNRELAKRGLPPVNLCRKKELQPA